MMKKHTMNWLLLVGIALLLAACGNGNGSQQPAQNGTGPDEPSPIQETMEDDDRTDGDPIEAMLQAFQSLEDFQGSVEVAFTTPDEGSLSMDVIMRGSLMGMMTSGSLPEFRGEVTDSTIGALPTGTIAVIASPSFFYNPEENTVLTAEQSAQGSGSQLYRLPLMFISQMTQALQHLTSPVINQTVVGEETVGDFTTTQIECTPQEGADDAPLQSGETFTVWIDNETSMPVQMVFERTDGEQSFLVTSMDINAGVEDDAFAFEPPADATTIDVSEPEVVASLDEASSSAGFAAPAPDYLPTDMPTEPTRVEVQQTPLGYTIIQEYTTEAEETGPDGNPVMAGITIQSLKVSGDIPDKLPSSLPPNASSSQVEVNGAEGVLISVGEGQATLSWQQDDMILTVRGSGGYGADEVTQVAEGLMIE